MVLAQKVRFDPYCEVMLFGDHGRIARSAKVFACIFSRNSRDASLTWPSVRRHASCALESAHIAREFARSAPAIFAPAFAFMATSWDQRLRTATENPGPSLWSVRLSHVVVRRIFDGAHALGEG